MNVSRTIDFIWTPWSLAISMLMVLAVAVLSFVIWKRSGYRAAIGALEVLRLSLVMLTALLFNQPEYIEVFQPEEKPTVAILRDDSPSMGTKDVMEEQSPSLATRREAAVALTKRDEWARLEDRLQIVQQTFGADAEGTNLFEPVAEAPNKFQNLIGVVLLSDGDWSVGAPPVQAASRLRIQEIPIIAIPVGSASRLPDVEVLSLDAPTFGVAGKSVRIPFTLESSLPRDYTTTVTLQVSGGEQVSKEIRVAAMGRTSDAIVWKAEEAGDFTLTLSVPQQTEETLEDNNERTAPISIRRERLQVLVVESYPRWEYRYLRNALSRDPGVEVSCLLFHPGLSKIGGGNRDYLKEFPQGLDALAKYDVVFLGDVGLGEGQLTKEQCRLLKGLVEHQASGLVFMPGWQGRQFQLLETELNELYPAVLDDAQTQGWGSRTPSHFELTELGRRSLLTKLADTEEDNIEVWEALPGFQWYAPVLRARAGSDVLAVHKEVTNEFGRLPLLITRTFGAGKVLFMGTDGAWRWRKGVEDKYHYRFWGQVVRWMAYQRNMAPGESMRLYYSPDQPRLEQTLALNANVMEANGEPISRGDVRARIIAPSGKAETIRFVSTEDEWGAFAGRYTTTEPGQHQLILSCQETGATLETSFFVQGTVGERVGKPARPEVLEELARVTGGKVLKVEQLDDVVNLLSTLPAPPPSMRRVLLWCDPRIAGLLVGLLGVFWVGRKIVGLI